jgi:hypothetical protein
MQRPVTTEQRNPPYLRQIRCFSFLSISSLSLSQYNMDSLSKAFGLQDSLTILQQYPYTINLIFAIVTILVVFRYFDPYSGTLVPGAPVVGARYRFEPLFITRYRFTLGCASIVSNNWRKVRMS